MKVVPEKGRKGRKESGKRSSFRRKKNINIELILTFQLIGRFYWESSLWAKAHPGDCIPLLFPSFSLYPLLLLPSYVKYVWWGRLITSCHLQSILSSLFLTFHSLFPYPHFYQHNHRIVNYLFAKPTLLFLLFQELWLACLAMMVLLTLT